MTFLTWSLNLLYPVLPLYFSGRGSCKDSDDPVVLRFSAFIGEPMIYSTILLQLPLFLNI